MKITSIEIALALLLCATPLMAQQGLIGTYAGAYEEKEDGTKRAHQHGTLELVSVQDGKVVGKFRLEQDCRGTYEVDGTYQGNKLDLRTSAGSPRGCGGEQLLLEMQGNKLVGTISGQAVQLLRK
jgi:hypothetical protein